MSSRSNHNHPPEWIKQFLSLFLDSRMLEASLGDLEEKFRIRLRANTPLWKVKLLYALEGLGFLKMGKRPRINIATQTTLNMISHTLLFFSRLVRKDKSYYLISLLGLALSLSSFLLIMMFIADELAYDKFHSKHDRIFRITTHLKLSDVTYNEATSQFPAAPALASELAEVEHAVRIYPQTPTLESGDRKFQERVIFADESFFSVFSFAFLSGEASTALQEPNSIVLSQTTAKKYFGYEDVTGKIILINGQPLTITGIIQDVPEQSHVKFDAIIPLTYQLNEWKNETGIEGRENKWFWTGAYTYLLLKDKKYEHQVRQKLPSFVNKYFPERYKTTGRFELQPLTDIHLNSSNDAELEPGGSMLYVRLFSIVGFVIIVVSVINLINLSYFKITSRIREMGIRKFLGQDTAKVIAQLCLESILIGVLAFTLAAILCQISISGFNLLVNKKLDLWATSNAMIAGATLLLILVLCVLAVIRPATWYATRSSGYFLQRHYQNGGMTSTVRNVLIGMQVCFSFVLLVFSFIISSQIEFFKHKDLGYDRENLLIVNMQDVSKLEAFKNELKKNKRIADVAGGEIPVSYNAWRFVPEGGSYDKPLMLPFTFSDYSFLNVMNIKLALGKNFDPKNNYDSLMPFLINKRAAIELGWADDPLNKTLEVFAPGTTEIMAKGRIIGVIEDYHFESLHRPVKPVVITTGPYFSNVFIRTAGDINEGVIASVAETWKQFSDKPFTYEVLDEKLEQLYTNEIQLSNVILFFTFIALFLTCYGLFAMSSLLFSSRLKEVAIRKVFGADQLAIIKQLYSKYAVFNLVAIIIGLPIAVYLGDLWLQTFEYKISLSAQFFVKAAIFILLAGLISVSYYLGKVAFSNPVKFLRRE